MEVKATEWESSMGNKNFCKLTEMFESVVGFERREVEKILHRNDTERRTSKPIESRISEQVSSLNCESDKSYRCVRVDGLLNRRYQKFKSAQIADRDTAGLASCR